MAKSEIEPESSFRIHPGRTLSGKVIGLYKAAGETFETEKVQSLELDFGGIVGDRHHGTTRLSGGREPWYERGTQIRNERQLSLLAPDELREIAQRLDVPQVKPQWIGGNLLIEGIADFSKLPPRTILFFEGGASVKIDGDNGPCRFSGRAIAANYEGRAGCENIELDFAKKAKRIRGLVGWVEKPARLDLGESVKAVIPEQWIYGRE